MWLHARKRSLGMPAGAAGLVLILAANFLPAQSPQQSASEQAGVGQAPAGQTGGRAGGGTGRVGGRGAQPRLRKALLAWADTRNGQAQHAFTSHALAVIERLGYDSGLWDTFIRTDSHIIFDQAQKTDGTPASGGHGQGRVVYSSLSHSPEAWDIRNVQIMMFEAIKWSLGLSEAPVQPHAKRDQATSAAPR
jgi:hypothetical protein